MKKIKETINNKKGIIFDLDGTVLDSMWVWTEIDKRFLGIRGFEVPKDYIEKIAPLGAMKAAEYTIERFNLDEKPEELVDEWFGMAMSAYENEVLCKPGAKEYIEQLSKYGKKLGVATSSDRSLIIPALKRNGILDFFDTIVTVDQVERGKGYPDIYYRAAKNMNLTSKDCVVFEDILPGIKGAKAGGFMAVGIYETHSDYEHPEMKEVADAFIMGFDEVMD